MVRILPLNNGFNPIKGTNQSAVNKELIKNYINKTKGSWSNPVSGETESENNKPLKVL